MFLNVSILCRISTISQSIDKQLSIHYILCKWGLPSTSIILWRSSFNNRISGCVNNSHLYSVFHNNIRVHFIIIANHLCDNIAIPIEQADFLNYFSFLSINDLQFFILKYSNYKNVCLNTQNRLNHLVAKVNFISLRILSQVIYISNN